jgi:hypothetical protein
MRHPALSALVLLLVPVLALAGCAAAAPSAGYDRVSVSTLEIAQPIPAPAGAATLTMIGKIAATNAADGLELDLATLERIGLIRYTVRDPWLEADLEFTGVLLTDLLTVVGAAPGATSLRITALDDYEVEISLADVRRWPIMLATQANGAPMSIEDKGPTRIVFPADPGIDTVRYKDFWIWQIKTIEVV